MRKFYLPIVLFSLVAAILILNGAHAATLLDPPVASVIATIPLGGQPKGIALDTNANQIYTVLYDTSRVVRIDGTTHSILAAHDTGGFHPNQIAFNSAVQRLFVTQRDSNDVSAIDPNTLNVIAKYPVGKQPWGIAADPVSGQVYVANWGSSSISVLGGADGALLSTLHVPFVSPPNVDRPALATYDAGLRRLYVMGWDTGNLYVVDMDTQTFQPLTIGFSALDVAVETDTHRVFMSTREDGNYHSADGAAADPNTMQAFAAKNLPGRLYSIAVHPNTRHVFIAAVYNGRMLVYVTHSQAHDLLQTLDLGIGDEDQGGQGLEINAVTNRVYLSQYATSSLIVIQDTPDAATPTPTSTATFAPTDTPPSTTTFTPTSTATFAATFTPTPTATATQPPSALPYVLTTFAVGTYPQSVTIDELHRFWGLVAMYDASRVVVFDVNSFSASESFYTQGTHPKQILYAGSNRVHITNRDSNNYAGFAWMGPGENCWAPAGELPWGVAATNDRVYVGNYGDPSWGSVSVFHLQCSALTTIPLPNDRPALMTSTNGKVYVAGHWQGNLYVIDSNNNVRNPINVGAGAFGLAAHGAAARVYLTNRHDGRLYIIDAINDNVTNIINLPGKASAVASNYKTNHVFVVDAENDRVYVLDGATGALLTTLPVGRQDADHGGQGIAVSLETNRVFVTNYVDGTITALQDVNTPALHANAQACPAPRLASWPHGATIPYRRVTLDWADPACATRYEIQIRQGSSKGKSVEAKTNVPFSQYTTGKMLKPGKSYVWHVRACGATGCSKWSGWWKFTVDKNAR
ncbi:MAG: YncE family protein [Chloroflexi bacterium]|nr:YncE family protein [Chloroflexota bacterium]